MSAAVTLQEPWACVALLCAVAAAQVVAWRRRGAARSAWFQPFALMADEPLPTTWRARFVHAPSALEVVALALLAIAISQPVSRKTQSATKVGVDLVLCLDASSSMAANDIEVAKERLQAAKSAATAFLASRPEDRIGLVRFSRYVDVVCPPTRDHAALTRMLQSAPLVERDGPEDATGIGSAVARCVQMLERATIGSRAIVLVTDGEENVASSGTPNEIGPLQAAQAAMRHGVRVHALVVGKQGGPDAIDTTQVEQMAQRTGGSFFRAGDANALANVYAEIDRLERSPIEEPVAQWEERFRPFALAALLCWLLSAVLRRTALEVMP